ncbi:MAG: 5'-methylthioadenosine/S-adenosylhomocysteine nucleosidase [Mycobacterium sp.]
MSRPVPETVIHVADVVAPTVATQPSIATTRPAQPSPPVVVVATRVVSEVANAVLTPLTATPTPGTPADPPSMWALMAFARREFEFAVRSPSMAGRPAEAQTTSETMVADAAVEPEKRTLVLTAFPAEADAILARTTLDENPVVVVDGRHYYLGTLGGKKIIVAMTGIGMENAADTPETALTHFTPESGVSIDAVVFAGVAGGSGRTQIGDVAVPAQWTSDDGATWHQVDPEMLAAADEVMVDLQSTDTIADPSCRICGPLSRLRLVNLDREPQLYVGGDGSSDDNNNGAAFPSIPLGGAIFGPQPLAAPDFSPLFTGNFFRAAGPFLIRGVVSNITGFLTATAPPVDAVDQETAAAQQVADAHGVPFLGIRGMSDGPGDPLNLPGYPFTFFVYKQLAADNAAIVTEAFLQSWDAT